MTTINGHENLLDEAKAKMKLAVREELCETFQNNDFVGCPIMRVWSLTYNNINPRFAAVIVELSKKNSPYPFGDFIETLMTDDRCKL